MLAESLEPASHTALSCCSSKSTVLQRGIVRRNQALLAVDYDINRISAKCAEPVSGSRHGDMNIPIMDPALSGFPPVSSSQRISFAACAWRIA